VDIAVQVGNLSDSRCIARVLNHGPLVTAAAPAYLKRFGEPKTPGDLAAHNCIVSTFGPHWPFNDGGNRIEVLARGNLVVTGGDALREAVLLGLGIAQSNWWTLRHDLAVGTLQPLLEGYAVEGRPISIVYPPTRHVPRKLRAMIDFLVEITRLAPDSEQGVELGSAEHDDARPHSERRGSHPPAGPVPRSKAGHHTRRSRSRPRSLRPRK